MSVKGHVISCDLCGQSMAMPTAMKHAEQQSREELVRGYAVGWGWRRGEDGDRCPEHGVDQASQGRFTHRLGGTPEQIARVLLGTVGTTHGMRSRPGSMIAR